MKVTNNGKGLIIETNFSEAAILTEAIRKSIPAYESQGLQEYADKANDLIDNLMNHQIVEIGGKRK